MIVKRQKSFNRDTDEAYLETANRLVHGFKADFSKLTSQETEKFIDLSKQLQQGKKIDGSGFEEFFEKLGMPKTSKAFERIIRLNTDPEIVERAKHIASLKEEKNPELEEIKKGLVKSAKENYDKSKKAYFKHTRKSNITSNLEHFYNQNVANKREIVTPLGKVTNEILKAGKNAEENNANYDGTRINLSKNVKHMPGVIAHEGGHQVYNKKELIPSNFPITVLAKEIDASTKGDKIMRAAGMNPLEIKEANMLNQLALNTRFPRLMGDTRLKDLISKALYRKLKK